MILFLGNGISEDLNKIRIKSPLIDEEIPELKMSNRRPKLNVFVEPTGQEYARFEKIVKNLEIALLNIPQQEPTLRLHQLSDKDKKLLLGINSLEPRHSHRKF
ncbi:MAG: hypothetical protein JSR80_06690 [Verrucomicrobia bacterium]|nr:hypothetical protein [Verrucomicrobiota bacterium]